MTDIKKALEAIDLFNRIRLRQPTNGQLPKPHAKFQHYLARRDAVDPVVDYSLLRKALGQFGTTYLAPLLQRDVRPLLQGVDATIDLGCGNGWVTGALGFDRGILVDREGSPPAKRYVNRERAFLPGNLDDWDTIRVYIHNSNAQLVILSEVLHCMSDPHGFIQRAVRDAGSAEWVLIIEQEDLGDELSAQLRKDFGPTNTLLTGTQIFSLMSGFQCHYYISLRQYSISLWRLE
jgi:hypothetical protein